MDTHIFFNYVATVNDTLTNGIGKKVEVGEAGRNSTFEVT